MAGPDRNILLYSMASDGSVFTVMPATPTDVTQLCSLENEFLMDHREMLADVLPDNTEATLCEELGLAVQKMTRRKTIQRIAASNSLLQWTLKCVYMPPPNQVRKKQIVGYCYSYIKQGGLSISHLKVSRSSQRRGCAMLLIAAAVRRAGLILREAHLRPAVKDLGKVAERLNLSVVKANHPARSLYKKLGFDQTEISGSPVQWVKMSRALPKLEEVQTLWTKMIAGSIGSIHCKVSRVSNNKLSSPKRVLETSSTLQEQLKRARTTNTVNNDSSAAPNPPDDVASTTSQKQVLPRLRLRRRTAPEGAEMLARLQAAADAANAAAGKANAATAGVAAGTVFHGTSTKVISILPKGGTGTKTAAELSSNGGIGAKKAAGDSPKGSIGIAKARQSYFMATRSAPKNRSVAQSKNQTQTAGKTRSQAAARAGAARRVRR
eukprot:TRINITY_DN51348_c0_g1_i1.p1 TRINITY_DN51348_c0_g1~~TRINITY_DN51348_c0_g1_i1.p1  ORF type:complete len:512 (+),score=72.65 TRINITY_DN51348_c0_g1_i1:231-1538(+)